MAVTNPLISEFQGGQMTNLPAYPGTADLTALMEIVSPGTAAAGVNYAITIAQLAAIIGVPTITNTVITTGATIGSPYHVLAADTHVLFNKSAASASYTVFGLASGYSTPVFFKDFLGDANVNPIHISFTGGQTCDGLAELVINSPFGWATINPISGVGGGWYQSS